MKARAFASSMALAALALAGSVSAQALDPKFDPSRLVTPPLKRIEPVKPERFVLPNGMVVFLLENHDLPIVSGEMDVRTVPQWIPADKVGLGRVTGETIRSGGSAKHSGDWLDDRLGAIGAEIGTSIDRDLANGSFHSLTENAPEVISLFAEILQSPAFPDDKIELAKVGLRQNIASRNDEMIPLLVRVAGQAVYGKDSPYARQAEYATVDAIQREDCGTLHKQVFEPSRMVLAVYGDFKTSEMKNLLTARFGSWKGAGVKLPELPPAPSPLDPKLVFAPKDDVTQSGMVLTHAGFRADDPDYPAMDVFQTALGGGFQSRLVNRIRTERGLAYATGAAAGEGYQRPGVFQAYSLTKSESTMVALDLLREEVRKAATAPFTDQELKTAKESVQNTFVFNFEQPSAVLFRAAFFEAIGYPQDFLEKYQQGLEQVTAQSVLEAAKRKVHPDHMVAVVVGKEKDFDRPLTSAGLPVERVDISIPPPASKLAVAAATPEALSTGRAWLKKAAEASGGAAAWAAIKSVNIEQEQNISMQGQTMNVSTAMWWALPDKRRIRSKLPMGEMNEGFDGSGGWRSMMGQVQDQPELADRVREDYERSLYHLLGHPDELEVQALPDAQTLDGKSYKVAFVKSDKVKDWTLAFGPDGRLARMEYMGRGPNGPVKQTQILDDWKPVAGNVQFPHTQRVLMDGKPFVETRITAARFNAAIPDSMFRKPNP